MNWNGLTLKAFWHDSHRLLYNKDCRSMSDLPNECVQMVVTSPPYWGLRKYAGLPDLTWGGDTLKRDTSKTAEYKEMQNIGYSSAFRVGRPMRPNGSGRNLRSVWTFPTQPYPEAHFATYPEKLVELCVKAATPEVGCCGKCGKPWVRITKPSPEYEKALQQAGTSWYPSIVNQPKLEAEGVKSKKLYSLSADYITLGWQPQCKCNAAQVPSIILDPFAGSGTTLKVAAELGRRAVGYELSEEYCKLAVKRNKQSIMGL